MESFSFSNESINYSILRERAFNLRWASLPKGVIPLTAADPDFPCAPAISEAITRFAKDRYFSYVPAEGYAFFREAISDFHASKRGLHIQPDKILPVDSAAFGIQVACKATLKPGDEAIVFDPVDFLFKYCIEQSGATARALQIPLDPSSPIDIPLLESLIGPRTKMLCLCNPVNPTGKVFTPSELQTIAEVAIQHNLIVLSDEIWSDIVFTPHRYTSIASLGPEISDHTITVSGYSKSYSLAGLRVGFVMSSNPTLFNKLVQASLHGSTVHGCNAVGQVAATAALRECEDWLEGFVSHLQSMRDLSLQEIKTIPGFECHEPQGCYLLFCNIEKTGKDSATLQQFLLENAKVAVVPGLPRWFGEQAAGHIRICFSTSEFLLREAFSRIRQAMTNL